MVRNWPKEENMYVGVPWIIIEQRYMQNKKVRSKTIVLNWELV